VVLEVLSQADKMKLAWTIFYDSDLVKMFENFVLYPVPLRNDGKWYNGKWK